MSTQVVDQRLQLVPAGTQPRMWMFSLCVLLPTVITAVALSTIRPDDAHLQFAGGNRALFIAAIVGAELVLMLAVWALLDRMMRRHRLHLSPAMLEVKTSFYSRSVPLSEMKLDEARVVDLEERTEFNPWLKTNGYSVPGFKSGRFRLKNGQKAFVAIAGERRALWLPTTRGNGLLLQPLQPEALLNHLRELAANPSRR